MNKENFSLVYFVTRALFLGIGYSTFFNFCGTDSIIACLLGTLLGIILIFIISKINIKSKISIFFLMILYIYFIMNSILILESFINSFFLIQTPRIVIIAPTILLCLFASFKTMKTIKKTSLMLLYIGVMLLVIPFISLANEFSIDSLKPLFSHSTLSIFKAAFAFAVISATPNILLIDEKIETKKHIIYYLITALINTTICIYIVGVLKPTLINIYSFPEYMVLKRIRIFEFIENIENIVASMWYLDIFVFSVLVFKRMQKYLKSKILFIGLITLVSILITVLLAPNYDIILFLYHYTPITLFSFLSILSILSLKKE